ncbi:flagellar hook-basal body complex protein FliE [Nitrosomonas eutropha]|uniref:flagellar hook-basal body complex protein FliE n=1 Tax=Nitrosomonas eutropha TaxID=916 RepID=UPI00088ADB84|nr:flagellar hook-basal body complex protein FliE [Nitrosomonas eutropha]SCX24555.1 flagellar hook-basal body complex protein FliE [Nitrosomonas eutropha]
MNIASGMDQMLAQLKATSDLAAGGNKPATVAPAASQADFGQLLKSAVDQVNTVQQTANQLSQEFVRGNQDVELHDVMISLQKANVSFQSMIQVRNRLVTAYQEIMNMQV